MDLKERIREKVRRKAWKEKIIVSVIRTPRDIVTAASVFTTEKRRTRKDVMDLEKHVYCWCGSSEVKTWQLNFALKQDVSQVCSLHAFV